MSFQVGAFQTNFQQVASVVVATPSGGGSSRRRKRTWKTTEEVLDELRRKDEFRYISAPETPTEPIASIVRSEFDYDSIEARIVESLIRKQEQITQERAKRKRKSKAASILLLDQ